MSIAVVSHTVAGSSDGNNVATPAIDTTGANFLVMVNATFGGQGTVSDSKGNTWTPLTQYGDAADKQCCLYYSIPASVGSAHTFTNTSTGKAPSIAVIALSGVKAIAPFDAENGAKATSMATIATGSVTPSEDNEILIAGYAGYSQAISAIDEGFTLLDSVGTLAGKHLTCGLAYLVQTTAASKNPTWTLAGSAVDAAAIASFKAAAGGGGGSAPGANAATYANLLLARGRHLPPC